MLNRTNEISLREVTIDDAELILKWRTKPRVTRYMKTDVIFDINKQKKWLECSNDLESYYHWIIQIGNEPAGFINLSDYSRENKITSWGYYIGEDKFMMYGGYVFPYFYNWAFDVLKVGKILAEVFFNNTNMILFHQLYGNKFTPQHDRVIVKNGKDVLIVTMELEKDLWDTKKYKKFIADFPIDGWGKRPMMEKGTKL